MRMCYWSKEFSNFLFFLKKRIVRVQQNRFINSIREFPKVCSFRLMRIEICIKFSEIITFNPNLQSPGRR